jgi:hypothetical protein
MSFLDRFKGKITKIGKEGIHEVIGSESAPVAKAGSTYYSEQPTTYKSKPEVNPSKLLIKYQ